MQVGTTIKKANIVPKAPPLHWVRQSQPAQSGDGHAEPTPLAGPRESHRSELDLVPGLHRKDLGRRRSHGLNVFLRGSLHQRIGAVMDRNRELWLQPFARGEGGVLR